MAFSFTLNGNGVPERMGRKKVVMGTWNAASVTTGDIVTGLSNIDVVLINNETGTRAGQKVTKSAGTATIAGVTSNDVGTFIAYGD